MVVSKTRSAPNVEDTMKLQKKGIFFGGPYTSSSVRFHLLLPEKKSPFVSLLILLIAGSLCLFHTTTAPEDTHKMSNTATQRSLGTATVRRSHCRSFRMSQQYAVPHLTMDVKCMMSFSVTRRTRHLVLLWMFTRLSFLVLGGRVLSFLHQFTAIWGLQQSIEEIFFVSSSTLVFVFHYSGLRSFAFFLLLFTDYLFL